jgi:lipopolysaccharide export system protein LptA
MSAGSKLLAASVGFAFAFALGVLAAQAATKAPEPAPSPIQILPGTNSKEPISIDADKLVYFDKEKKAVYSGNVVVVQGETKMTCSTMTVYLDQAPAPNGKAAEQTPKPAADSQQGGPSQGSGVKRLEAAGPVTVVSKTQVATSDSAVYDKAENRVQMIGRVTLSDGSNVTKGDKLTYDLKTGVATVETGSKAGRVHGQFTPNGGAEPGKPEPAKPK